MAGCVLTAVKVSGLLRPESRIMESPCDGGRVICRASLVHRRSRQRAFEFNVVFPCLDRPQNREGRTGQT